MNRDTGIVMGGGTDVTNSTEDQQAAKRKRDWWRICWRALMAVSAAAAIVASYTYLRDLAIICGWTQWRTPLLPVSLDVLGIAAFALYIRTRDGYAQAVSVLVVAASAAGNALSHLYAVTGTEPASAVVVAVGSTPVVVAMVLAHLWAHERKETDETGPSVRRRDGTVSDAGEVARPAGGVETDPGRVRAESLEPATTNSRARDTGAAAGGGYGRQPVPGAAVVRPGSNGSRRGRATRRRTDGQLVAETVTSGWTELSGDELASRLKVAKGRALSVRAQARTQQTLSAGNGKVAAGTGS